MNPYLRVRLCSVIALAALFAAVPLTRAQRQMENLGRGVVAIHQADGKIFVSWRLLGTDPENIAFNLYRKSEGGAGRMGGFRGGMPPGGPQIPNGPAAGSKAGAPSSVAPPSSTPVGGAPSVQPPATAEANAGGPPAGGPAAARGDRGGRGGRGPGRGGGGGGGGGGGAAPGEPVKLNSEPITGATYFVDTTADLSGKTSYFVRPVLNGVEQAPSAAFTLAAGALPLPYFSIPLRTPAGYTPGDISVGDLDGDGEYEIVLHQTGQGRDNAQAGITDPPILQAYKLDGTFLWEINLGKNIREGAHYTQFMVYDLDGDGRAEIVCKTADGTVDGVGKVIGDPKANYVSPEGATGTLDKNGKSTLRSRAGYVLDGPEYLTVFDGRTGAALATTDYYPPRGKVADWGDNYGNRVDRFLACVAYLDGVHPSVVMCRGYYTRTVLAAYDWRDGQLTKRWVFDSDDGTPGNEKYRGQGDHQLSVADVDGDGKDEIVYGACVINHDGKGLYSTGRGHGDAMHVSDLDPDRPGLEVWMVHERPSEFSGGDFRDAKTGEMLWKLPSTGDAGRGMAAHLDPRYKGYQCWSAPSDGLYSCKGVKISDKKPRSVNFAVWWDGSLQRQLLDRNYISHWNWADGTETTLLTAQGCSSNNGTKATPALSADLFGDWREEVIWRTNDGKELRIYTSTFPTEHRFYTLMHDPQYRLAIAWQNVAYNQPPHPGFYIGEGMAPPPRPNIVLVGTNKL
jgi:rhamnogalacturonan endolyase